MRGRHLIILGMILLAAGGCGKDSTAKLIENLKSPDGLTRLRAVRTLPRRTADAEQVIPALIEALKDEEADVRKGAAHGLGTFADRAADAIPALQTALTDRDPEVRKAAGVALLHIDPNHAPKTAPPKPGQQ
jgi:HEAT repeat protein